MKKSKIIGAIALAGYMFSALHINVTIPEELTHNEEVKTSEIETQDDDSVPLAKAEDIREKTINLEYILEESEYPDYWNTYLNDIVWLEASLETGIEVELLMAISIHETGNFTSYIFNNYNNVGGNLDKYSKAKYFDSFESGVLYMANNLIINRAYSSIDWNQDTESLIKDIQKIYAPSGATNDPNNLNSYWVSGITKYYNNIKNNEKVSNTITLKLEELKSNLYS